MISILAGAFTHWWDGAEKESEGRGEQGRQTKKRWDREVGGTTVKKCKRERAERDGDQWNAVAICVRCQTVLRHTLLFNEKGWDEKENLVPLICLKHRCGEGEGGGWGVGGGSVGLSLATSLPHFFPERFLLSEGNNLCLSAGGGWMSLWSTALEWVWGYAPSLSLSLCSVWVCVCHSLKRTWAQTSWLFSKTPTAVIWSVRTSRLKMR